MPNTQRTHTVDGNLSGDTQLGNRLTWYGVLAGFKLEIPAILIAKFIGGIGGEGRDEFRDSPVVFHKIASEAFNSAIDDCGRLDALRRVPAEPVVAERSVVI